MSSNRASLSPAQVGRRLQLPVATPATSRHRGNGPAYYKFGQRVRYRLEEINV
ncbi:MAG: DNA-binding protein [Alphaproteobacteria bacterium]|nr:DNA-binding protein [Alphaproteobacteria bacterium]